MTLFIFLLLAFFRQTFVYTIDKFDVYQGITMTALPRKNMWQIVLTIILVGINLRPFLTGPGPCY